MALPSTAQQSRRTRTQHTLREYRMLQSKRYHPSRKNIRYASNNRRVAPYAISVRTWARCSAIALCSASVLSCGSSIHYLSAPSRGAPYPTLVPLITLQDTPVCERERVRGCVGAWVRGWVRGNRERERLKQSLSPRVLLSKLQKRRGRESGKETDRQTDRQRNTQRHTERHRNTDKDKDRERERKRERAPSTESQPAHPPLQTPFASPPWPAHTLALRGQVLRFYGVECRFRAYGAVLCAVRNSDGVRRYNFAAQCMNYDSSARVWYNEFSTRQAVLGQRMMLCDEWYWDSASDLGLEQRCRLARYAISVRGIALHTLSQYRSSQRSCLAPYAITVPHIDTPSQYGISCSIHYLNISCHMAHAISVQLTASHPYPMIALDIADYRVGG
eukprot:340888-Rhodomonas_salina.1